MINRRTLLAGAGSYLIAQPGAALPADDVEKRIVSLVRQHGRADAVLRMLVPQGSEPNVRPVAERFMAATGIKTRIDIAPVNDINTVLLLRSGKGAANDVALPATFGIPELADAGIITSVDDPRLRPLQKSVDVDALYKHGDAYEGKRFGYQTDGDVYVMFFRKDWLEDADEGARYKAQFGQTLKVAASWPELDRQMAFFHRPQLGRFGGALFRTPGFVAWEWWLRFHAYGGHPVDGDFEPLIHSSAGVRALEDMVSASEYLHPRAKRSGLFENWALFSEGDCFANIGWGGTQKGITQKNSIIANNLVHSPPPGGDLLPSLSHFNWGWSYVVNAQASDLYLARLFALFAVCPVPSTAAVEQQGGFFDPFRKEHYSAPGIQRTYGASFLAAQKTAMRSALPDFYVTRRSDFMAALTTAITAALAKQQAPRAALKKASTQWSILAHKVGRNKLRRQWRSILSLYPPEIRSASQKRNSP